MIKAATQIPVYRTRDDPARNKVRLASKKEDPDGWCLISDEEP